MHIIARFLWYALRPSCQWTGDREFLLLSSYTLFAPLVGGFYHLKNRIFLARHHSYEQPPHKRKGAYRLALAWYVFLCNTFRINRVLPWGSPHASSRHTCNWSAILSCKVVKFFFLFGILLIQDVLHLLHVNSYIPLGSSWVNQHPFMFCWVTPDIIPKLCSVLCFGFRFFLVSFFIQLHIKLANVFL